MKWSRLLNPSDFGLPEWVDTVRPMSHLADNCVCYSTSPAAPKERVHFLMGADPKESLFRILRDGTFEEPEFGLCAYRGSGTVIGEMPFKIVKLDGKSVVAPARGGVSIGSNVEIGANTVVDRGIYGEHTTIMDDVKIDNLVHVAHSVTIGTGAFIVAGVVLGGWCEIGARAWIGMGAQVLPHVKVGESAYVGAGAVVNRDVPPHSLVYGNPARINGGSCCNLKLAFEGTLARCRSCQREFGLSDGIVVPL